MRWGAFVAALVMVLALGQTTWAKGGEGFAGTPFGSRLAALPSFMKLKTVGDINYAVNLNEPYRLNGKAPVVFYGFVQGRMFAAYVRLDGIIGHAALAKRLTAEFGKPSIMTEGGTEILRWRKGDLKVKLKFDPAAGSLKLAYYSIRYGSPAARVLAEPDAVDLDELARTYEKDKIAKGVTLPKGPARKWYSPNDAGIADPTRTIPGK
ncbi:conserved hypothetical protein [Solidesulfovibrio fructosivorans JJ]]|uniref:Uncharacterized protein n=1 Tax=Solidesulfovibrio fructosivorans JJ] TaxID=596151 RepID=E1JRY4_SOLFR|nr:hypothetical protein [Solidesulfovibrio fructosivorans]EFL52753.1 conserved hypothetical protein [Solidesulfovibrio fructosivorans JJ]]